MGVRETCIIYLLIGVAVGVAFTLKTGSGGAWSRAAGCVAGVLFWPLFAPLVLGAGRSEPRSDAENGGPALDARIHRAEEKLVGALSQVEGVAEEVIAPEVTRVRGLAGSMASMARRVRDMDALLASQEFDPGVARAALQALAARGVGDADPRAQSIRARLRNIERLEGMRARTADDLERIVLKLEEMSSQIHLLKFAGRSDEELVGMIKGIAESVAQAAESLLQTA
jgi:hypothetical protein